MATSKRKTKRKRQRIRNKRLSHQRRLKSRW